MERSTAHDTELAARLARLDARRQSAGAATSRQGVEAPSPSAARPGATRTKRRHPARRSRIGVTIGSVAAMVGLTSYMAMSEQSSSASAVTVDTTVVAAGTTASTTAATAATTATTNAVALSATPATAATAVTTTTAAQVTTTSAGS